MIIIATSIVVEFFKRYAEGETIREAIADFNHQGLKVIDLQIISIHEICL